MDQVFLLLVQRAGDLARDPEEEFQRKGARTQRRKPEIFQYFCALRPGEPVSPARRSGAARRPGRGPGRAVGAAFPSTPI
ncbi:hypothetical protein [Sorangium sp. So ce887]|uniref:hypothetical protein n=1 Tax=Sorangium sp. So ce887 TaxID=3133324 RepID=UPI003F5F0C59